MSPESLQVKLRQARGAMSLTAAAERSGIAADRIRMYEEGERQPYGKTLRRLAQAYGVSVSELRGRASASATGASARRTAEAQTARSRRRRRRVTAGADGGADAQASVEVPIEVQEGQTIRVVIELIIRPKAPVQAAGPGGSSSPPGGSAAGPGGGPRAESGTEGPAGWASVREGGGKAGPWGAESRVAERTPPGTAEPAQSRPDPFSRTRPSRSASERTETARDRPAPVSREGPNGRGETVSGRQPALAAGQPRDPLDEFRRAYSQFRRRKKS